MDYLFKILQFFRITESNKVSLVNLALMIVVFKLARSQAASITDTVPMLLALASHHLQDIINPPTPPGQ